jgi:serine/threonine protein phosphatase PrpC
MDIKSIGLTDVGLRRDHNEDSHLVDPELGLYIVADGMGGHAAGEVASATAVRHVRRVIEENKKTVDAVRKDATPETCQATLEMLIKAVEGASTAVYEMAQSQSDKKGMGTTLSLLMVAGERGFIAHVGDSRIYLIRRAEVHQLTEDHTLVAAQLKAGLISAEEAAKAVYSNVITRAVGVQELVQVDATHFDVLSGDRFLLCSDGLHGYLAPGEIEKLLGADLEDKVMKGFIDLANSRGGKDNITAIGVEVTGARSNPDEVFLKIDTLKKIPLFRNLNYREIVEILNITEVQSFDKGDVIVEEGTTGREFYVLLAGEAEVVKEGVVIARLRTGSHFGEMALVDRFPRSATIRAGGPLKVSIIDRKDFYEIIRQGRPLAVKLLWAFVRELSTRLRESNRLAADAVNRMTAALVADLQDITDDRGGNHSGQPDVVTAPGRRPPPAPDDTRSDEGVVN